MKPWELYNHIWQTEYRKSGFDLDWQIELDNSEKKIRVLFQPSTSTKDWVVNILGFLPVLRGCLFYCFGWKKVYDQVNALIMNELMYEINHHTDYTVEVCGHSYGGAMSINCAIAIYEQTGVKADVVTFGAPRPLFYLWSKLIAKCKLGKVTQYAHWSDIVTYMPPLLGYHNVTVNRIGKLSFKGLFKPGVYHLSYDKEELY